MGSELVDDSLSQLGDGGGNTASSFTQIFYEHLPHYLAMGMSSDEFWLKDVCLAKAYRQSDEIRKDRENEKLWLQGAYIYDALQRVAPLYQLGGGKSEPYPSEPYPRTEKQCKEAEEREHKRQTEESIAYLKRWQTNVNNSRKGEDNG